MIIGISGKIGSGKDTVGQMIQFLTSPNGFGGIGGKPEYIEDFIKQYEGKTLDCEWEIKKFADKLKDITCLLIGCTREQLEDRTFKEAELGKEWDITPFSNMKECNHCGYEHDTLGIGVLTPRKILQLLGTDCGRDIIHPNIWVNALFADYKWDGVTMTDGWVPTYSDPDNSGLHPMAEPVMPKWLITDTRFPNEAEAILERGGILIRVNRGDGKTGNHASETSLDNYEKFTYIIDNNGGILDLFLTVKEILIKERVI